MKRPWSEKDTRALCGEIAKRLTADAWGDIEPEVFVNAGNGVFRQSDDRLVYDKDDAENAAASARAMFDVIHQSVLAMQDKRAL